MFGKILNFRFPSVSEAKLAASFCSGAFSKISEFDIIGLNIFHFFNGRFEYIY